MKVNKGPIATHKQIKNALRGEKNLGETIIKTGQCIILVLDTRGRIVRFNPYMEKISGYSLAEVQGKNWFNTFLPKGDRKRIRRLFLNAIRNIQTRGNVNPIVTKDGRKCEIEWYVNMLKDAHGNVIGLLAIGHNITQRILAENMLRESENKYRLLFENANDAIFLHEVSRKGPRKIFMVNKAACRMLGYTQKELEQMTIADIDVPEQKKKISAILDRLFSKGNAVFETEHLRKNGSRIPVIVSIRVFDFQSTKVMLSIVRDISERKRIEKILAYKANLLANINDAVIALDMGYRIRCWNRAAERLYGFKAEDVIGRTRSEVLHTEYIKTSRNAAIRMLRETGQFQGELIQQHRSGQKINIETKSIALKDASGRVTGYVSVNRDITKSKKVHEILRSSEAKYKNLIENASDLIFMIDRNLKVLSVNRAAAVVLKKRPVEIEGRSIFELFPPEISCRYAKSLRQVFSRSVGSAHESRLTVAGTDMSTSVRLSPITNTAGKVIAVMGITRDVTERKQAEEELHKTMKELKTERSRMKELVHRVIMAQENERRKIAVGIHDELLQGLVSVLYFLQVIKPMKFSPKVQRYKEKLMTIIKDSIDRGRNLIKEIQPLGEPQTGLTRAVKRFIALNFASSNVKITFNQSGKLPKLDLATSTNILRIIQEALINIRKHAHATRIKVGISTSNDVLSIKIQDNGTGFRPKTTLDSSTGHYGLLTMKERARLAGGEISIESTPHKGTTVVGSFSLKAQNRKSEKD